MRFKFFRRFLLCILLILVFGCFFRGKVFAFDIPAQSLYYAANGSLSVDSRFLGLGRHIGYNNYVYYRCGQYQYVIVYGDLAFDSASNVFSGSDLAWISLSTNSSGSTYYSWGHGTFSSFSLSVGDSLVYSNLGFYPGISFDTYQFDILIPLILAALVLLIVLLGVIKVYG